MTGRRVVVGVDSSTQSCKAEVRDVTTGALLGRGAGLHPPAFPPRSEQHPHDWWSALSDAVSQALAAAGSRAQDVAAVSVAAQCHGLVALGAHERVLRPAPLWNDTTCAEEVRELRRAYGDERFARTTGSVPTAAFTVGKLARLARQEPAVLEGLRQVLLPHDYLTQRLTGRAVTDRSGASGTGYYDAAEGTYLPEVLALVDSTVDWDPLLPEVLGPDEAAGPLRPEAAEALGLRTGTPVGPGGGDQHASALGLGVEVGEVVYAIGTSGVVLTRSAHPVVDVTGVVDGVADMTGGHLPLVSTLNAARVTDSFARLLGVDHQGLARLALAAEGPGPVLLAYLDGERKPDLPDARGSLTGITSATSREELARAAHEGVLLGLVSGQGHLARCGAPVDGLVVITGGGARSAAYPQLLADLLGRAVHAPDPHEASESTARGACVQAAAVATSATCAEVAGVWRPALREVARPRDLGRDPWAAYARAAEAAGAPAPTRPPAVVGAA